jgi:hypothetical protein
MEKIEEILNRLNTTSTSEKGTLLGTHPIGKHAKIRAVSEPRQRGNLKIGELAARKIVALRKIVSRRKTTEGQDSGD